jgi:hypothetical protein
MALHPRLGAGSRLGALLDKDLVRMVLDFV